jgi:hypothetical protein
MNKKGDFVGWLFVIAFVAAFAIFLLVLGYVTPLINDQLVSQIGISPEINNSFAISSAVATNTFPVIWLLVFSGLMLGVFATAYMTPSNPIFFPFFVILLVVGILVAIPLSNAYESMTEVAVLTSTSIQQQAINFMMLQLPYVALILGLIVLIISFAKPSQNEVLVG